MDVRKRISTFGQGFSTLLPSGELVLQTFQDQKSVRTGIGDILFAPVEPKPIPKDDRAALQRMLSVLDPEIGATTR